jgi:hypothetical protein
MTTTTRMRLGKPGAVIAAWRAQTGRRDLMTRPNGRGGDTYVGWLAQRGFPPPLAAGLRGSKVRVRGPKVTPLSVKSEL